MPGRFEPSEQEALAGLSSCFSFQNNDRSQDTMFVVTPNEPIYHLAKGENSTLCHLPILSRPDQRRRREDRRLVAEIPTNRICALCSECAELSGDTRSFSQRVTYPS